MMRQWFAMTAATLTFCTLGMGQARGAIIFTDNFDAGASPLWGNEIGNWTVTANTYAATNPITDPIAYSSLPFILSDFSIDLDINDIQDGGIWLRSTEAAGTQLGRTGVVLVTGGFGGTGTGLYWHIVTDGNSAGPILNEIDGLFDPGISDASLRIEVSGNTYSAFFNGASTPTTTLTTNVFANGQIALAEISNQTFDNLVVDDPNASTVPEPSSSILLTLIGASIVYRSRSRKQQ